MVRHLLHRRAWGDSAESQRALTGPAVGAPMRPSVVLLAAAAALLLSGCAAPTNKTASSPLLGLCPQWVQGHGGLSIGVHIAGAGNESHELGPADPNFEGRPLDLYRLHVDQLAVAGRLEMRAFAADGKQLAVRDYRQPSPQLVPVVVFTDGSAAGHEFDVFLSPVSQNGTAAPAPVTLRFTADGNGTSMALSVTYHYKVCGAEV